MKILHFQKIFRRANALSSNCLKMYYGRKLVSNSVLNEAHHEIEFMWNGQLRTMKIQMFRDEISKQLIFEITANVPRFEIEEISIKGSATIDVYEIGHSETPGLQMMGDNGTRVFRSDIPITDVVQLIYLFFEV